MKQIIKVLGTGCPKCKKTIAVVEAIVKEYKLDFSVEKVEDIEDIMKYVLSTPAVVLNEKVLVKGRVPSRSEMVELLT